MKVTPLNLRDRSSVQNVFAERPWKHEVVSLLIRGRQYLYDARSMALVSLSERFLGKEEGSVEVLPVNFACKRKWLQFVNELGGGVEGIIALSGFPTHDEPQFPLAYQAKMRRLLLQVTHRCNLACTYCYRTHGMYRGLEESMTKELVIAALKEFGNPPVAFFGGEPLLAWELIRWIVEMKGETQKTYALTTNGILVTDEMAQFMKVHGFNLIVSIDGTQEQHDAERKDPNGSGTYTSVIDGLTRLKKAGMRPALRATYTFREPALLTRMKHLNQLMDEGLGGSVAIEPVSLPFHKSLAYSVEKTMELEEEYLDCADFYIERVRQGKRAGFKYIDKMLSRVAYRTPNPTECGAGWGSVCLSPRGDLYACHREGQGKLGKLAKGMDERERMKWMDNRHYAKAKCCECWLRWACGGGCRMDALEQSGNVHMPAEVQCLHRLFSIKAAFHILGSLTREELTRCVQVPKGLQGLRRSRQ